MRGDGGVEFQDALEHIIQGPHGGLLLLLGKHTLNLQSLARRLHIIDALFDQLEIVIAEVRPEELVGGVERVGIFVGGVGLRRFADDLGEARQNPAVERFADSAVCHIRFGGGWCIRHLAQMQCRELRRIPQLADELFADL